MKLSPGKIVATSVLALLYMSGIAAEGQARKAAPGGGTMSLWQARRTVVANIGAARNITSTPASFRFTFDSFEFEGIFAREKDREHFRVDLKSLKPVITKRRRNAYYLKDETGEDLPPPLGRLMFWGTVNERNEVVSAEEEDARKNAVIAAGLAAALNRLRAFANDADAPLRTFAPRATAWRALSEKPSIPEEIRVQRLLAENAVKEKKPAEALNEYEIGLQLYPAWPQGWFNAALIAAELGFYAQAIEHMQAYLELAPDAKDAESVRDQIAIWQHKVKQNAAN